MTKQTKMYLGLGAIALVGYYIWKQSQQPKTDGEKKNAMGRRRNADGDPLAPKTDYRAEIKSKTNSFKGSNIAMRNRNK
jgi:hypothetical protein